MSYKKIQFIAYVLQTGFGTAPDGSSFYCGVPVPPPVAGATQAQTDAQFDVAARADILARRVLMQRAMELALSKVALDPTTLKVFMAPEFYFRGIAGAYQMNHVQFAIHELQTVAKAPKWADWLFVFGSILGTSAPPAPSRTQEVYNFALVQAGGPANDGPIGAKVVLKEWKSNIDFISRSQAAINAAALLPMPPTIGMTLWSDMVQYMEPMTPDWYTENDRMNCVRNTEVQQLSYDGGGIFSSCGVTFGLEICLDHLNGRLVAAQLPGAAQVQVQLVPSCGVANLVDTSLIAGRGGQVLGCDGNGYGSRVAQVPPLNAAPMIPSTYPVDASALAIGAGATPVAVATLFPIATASTLIGIRPQTGTLDPGAEAGAVVLYSPAAMPAPSALPGKVVTMDWIHPQGVITFSLAYDANGKFTQALCRMTSMRTNLNRFLFVIPPGWDKAVIMYDIDARGNQSPIRLWLESGSDGYEHAIGCQAACDAFRFQGIAIEFYDNPDARQKANSDNDGKPKTVGLVFK